MTRRWMRDRVQSRKNILKKRKKKKKNKEKYLKKAKKEKRQKKCISGERIQKV